MLKRDVSPWGGGNFSGILPLQDGSAQAPQGRLLAGQNQPFLGHRQLLHIFQPQNNKFIEVFLLSFHPNMHLSTYTHNKCVILLMAQKKPYDRCRSGTILSPSNAMQISQSVISCPMIPMDEMMNSERKVKSSAWSEEPLLRWVGVCGGEMLINYSVWLRWDEKHSNQIHRRRGILQKDGPCSWLAWRWSHACQLRERKKASHSLFWREMTKKIQVFIFPNLHPSSGKYWIC